MSATNTAPQSNSAISTLNHQSYPMDVASGRASPLVGVAPHASTDQLALYALQAFKGGDHICAFGAKQSFGRPGRFTVQVAEDRHIELKPTVLAYINHSCDPNIFFDLDLFQVVCLRPVAIGDELTFFYPSTEWSLSEGFACRCGVSSCLGYIRGAEHLPPQTQQRLSPHILRMLEGAGPRH